MRKLLIGLIVAAGTADAHAQRIIYDGTRDATAQQTVEAVKEITSGALFDKMLHNVDAQAKLEADAMLAFVREQMRAHLIGLDVWYIAGVNPLDPLDLTQSEAVFERNARDCPRSVECLLRQLRDRHKAALAGPDVTQADLDRKLGEIKGKIATLQAELKALKDAMNAKSASPVDELFGRLESHGAKVLEFANAVVTEVGKDQGRFKGASKALDEVGKGLEQVLKIYQVTRDIWTSRDLVSIAPASLRPPPQQTEIQLLLIQQEHLRTRARLEAKRQIEVSAALRLVDGALTMLHGVHGGGVDRSAERIEDTLRAAAAMPDRRRLKDLLRALNEVAAAAAQMEAADQLAKIRLADEQRRFSIRQSAIQAGTYEVALRTAAQRLAAYWKRGMKPGDVAQFAAWVANTIALIEVAREEN